MQTKRMNSMEQTIEELKNEIMRRLMKHELIDRVLICRELENFCGEQADEALKMEYDLAAMEEAVNEE